MIFDGASFGTATPAGSDEEADYFGLPGLLDADQMRDLLLRRQEEQLDRRVQRSPPVPGAGHHARAIAGLAPRTQRPGVGRAPSPGKPHGWIHNELRRLCGGPPVAAATSEQLRARIVAVRD